MSASQYRRTCEELGVCQGRSHCAACAHPFAPGAIEHHRSRQRAELARWMRRAVRVMAWSAGISLLAGIATGARAAGADEAAQAERPAMLPTTVGLHLVSHHTRTGCELAQPGQCLGWNNRNPGVYARWANGLTVGVLRNSLYRTGVYAAWTLERDLPPVAGLPVSVAFTAGITSGYDRVVKDDFAGHPGKGQHTGVRCDAAGRCRTALLRDVITPLLVPSVAVQVAPGAAVRLGWVPKVGTDADHAIHLSVEFKLP